MKVPDYYLLPFNFDEFFSKEILVNLIGDFLIVKSGTAEIIVNRRLENYKLYKNLVSNHFISQKPESSIEILSTRYRTKKAFLEEFTSLHIIVITLRCNQSCSYCQVSSVNTDKTCYDIKIEDLKKAIEMIMAFPSKNLTIEFQGGEPLLAFDLVKFAIEYVESLNSSLFKNIRFVICSNSIAVNYEVLDYLKVHSVLLSTSLDGPESIHNKHRKHLSNDSYQVTVKGILLAKSCLGKENVSALMTTTSNSLHYPKLIIDEYRKLGFTNIFLREINPYGLASNWEYAYSTNDFIKFYKKAFNYILELNRIGETFIEDYASIILRKILTPFNSGFVDLQSPSGIINSVLVYNYDGYVYVSDEARMMAEKGDYKFRLGHVNDGIIKILKNDLVKEIAKYWSNESLSGCSDCVYNVYCGADPVRNYLKFGEMEGYRPDSDFCTKNKSIIKFLIKKSLNPEYYKIFQSWLSN